MLDRAGFEPRRVVGFVLAISDRGPARKFESMALDRARCSTMAAPSNVPTEGVEPTRPCGHRILSPARLPIPPRRLSCRDECLTDFDRNARDSWSGRAFDEKHSW